MENEVVSYLRCANPECKNPVPSKARKYCTDKCLKRAMTLRNMDAYKNVYKDLDGWAGGPRGLTKVESSIKHDETYIIGDGRFAVDDYHVDPDIFAIAEANHEKYVRDRNEHEARVVLAGLEAFTKEYNKHHEVSYASQQNKKRQAKLTKDQKKAIEIKQKQYFQDNREKINRRSRERYAKNPSKYKEYSKKYYETKKEIIAQARKIRSERS